MKYIIRCMACLYLILLVSCSSIGSTQATTVQPTMLRVTRSAPPMLHLSAFQRVITDKKQLQTLYNAALSLPSPPKGTSNCLTSSYGGLHYTMDFSSNGSPTTHMDLDAATCRFLTIGQSDTRQTDDAFIHLFTQTIGLPSLLPITSHLDKQGLAELF